MYNKPKKTKNANTCRISQGTSNRMERYHKLMKWFSVAREKNEDEPVVISCYSNPNRFV